MRIASQEGASPKTIVVVDLDVDSDNDGAIADADDPIEDDAGRPGKAIPVNQGDGDADGIPDFADGFDLNGYGGGYQQNALELSMVPVRLTLAGLPDPNRVRLKFDYPASDPGAVTRDTAEPGSMFIFRSDPDPPVLYKYTKGGGPHAGLARAGQRGPPPGH